MRELEAKLQVGVRAAGYQHCTQLPGPQFPISMQTNKVAPVGGPGEITACTRALASSSVKWAGESVPDWVVVKDGGSCPQELLAQSLLCR